MDAQNPFTALTFISAPALLTNATSVLALSTAENGVLRFPLRVVVGIVQLGRRMWNSRLGYLDFGFNFASSSHVQA